MARHRKLTQKFAGFPMFKLATGGDTYPLTSPFTSDFVGLDGLALDLQFASDKTLTARKGPTPAFTRASSGTFVGSNGLIQSAGTNVARFDHDPVTLACKGLLIEESRTNSIADSNAFNNWSVANSTVAASSAANPEGSLSAWKVVEDLLLANHTVARAFSPVSGTTYTASMWLKSAENGFAFMGLSGGGFATTFISVNLSTGAVSTATGTPIGATSVAHSNGWWRVSFSLAATSNLSSTISIRLSRDGDWANRSYLGNGVNGMYVYGAQVEAGSFPTSYIPTTTASVIRSADVCSISGSAFSRFYNQTEGTALVKTIGGDSISSRDLFRFSETIAPIDSIFISGYSRFLAAEVGIITNNSQQLVHFGSLTRNFERLSLAYAQNNAAYVRNGTIEAIDISVTTSSSITQLSLGGEGINGCISSFRYYKKRLPNAKLRALTV